MKFQLEVMNVFRILDFDVNAKIQLPIGRFLIEAHCIIVQIFGPRRQPMPWLVNY